MSDNSDVNFKLEIFNTARQVALDNYYAKRQDWEMSTEKDLEGNILNFEELPSYPKLNDIIDIAHIISDFIYNS
jgi:hypothetical protein